MPIKTSAIRDEIKQTRPFHSAGHEGLVSILRTAAVVQRRLSAVIEAHGITFQQYNVLRILRGAGGEGLPTLAIRDRMIDEAAGITRLLDKLEASGHVKRERCTPDRRQVLCQITAAGLALLAALDAPVHAVEDAAVAMLDVDERQSLLGLLGAVRAGCRTRADGARDGVDQGASRDGQLPR
jgi:DNA-binding MarR family transcriptional regulator